MDCKKVNKLLIRYLEGDLDEQFKSFIKRHLQECRQCEGEFLLLKQILETAKPEEAPSPSEDYWANYTTRLWQKIEHNTPSGKPARNWLRSLRWAVPAFVLAILSIICVNSFYKKESPVPSTTKAPAVQKTIQPVIASSPMYIGGRSNLVVVQPMVPKSSALINLANGIYEFYNPAAETTEVLDSLYAQVTDIENVIEEEKDYLNLIDEMTKEERQELIARIQKTLL